MNSQEQQLLQGFLKQLVEIRGTAKDPQADALISKAAAEQPDATYLLVQRVLLMEQALANAKAQITQLQSQTATTNTSSFLGNNAWGRSAASTPEPVTSPYPSDAKPSQPGFLSGGMGSFLGTVAATAAGVAGGAFLFQGIENLLGHHGSSGSLGQGLTSAATESTAANHHSTDGHSSPPSGENSLDGLSLNDNFVDDIGSDDASSV